MKGLAKPAVVAASIGLVLIANLTLLGSAAWNRRGEPLAKLSLTERELALPGDRQEENSGLFLSLRLANQAPDVLRRAAWTRRADLPRERQSWLDREKLRELGFRVDVDPRDPTAADYYSRTPPRRAYVVLEYDGEAQDRWLADRQAGLAELRRKVEAGAAEASELAEGEALLAFDRVSRSRLFPVDAGRNAAALHRRYADRGRFFVVPGLVRLTLSDPADGPVALRGRVQDLLNARINVPRQHRTLLEPLRPTERDGERNAREREAALNGWPSPTPPRYRAVLALGHGFEPWLVRVEALEPADDSN